MASSDRDDVPEEIEETCLQCHEALAGVDRLVKPVLAVNRTTIEDKVDTHNSYHNNVLCVRLFI